MFPYAAILKKAYLLARDHFQLWVFGVFISLATALNFLFINFVLDRRQFVDISVEAHLRKIADGLDSPWTILSLALAAAVLFLAALSKATVIWSAQKLSGGGESLADKDKDWTVQTALQEGAKFVWPIFRLQVFLLFLFLILLVSLAAPVVYLAVISEIGRAVALALLGLAIFVPVSILLVYIFIYSPIFVVLYKVSVRSALHLGFRLVQNKLKESLLLGAFLLGVSGVFITLMVFSIIVLSVPVAFLSLVFAKLAIPWAIYTLVFLTALLGSCAVVILSAGFTIFNNLVWVLAVMEMVKTEKTDEEAKVLAPEAEPVA
ncbi:MAG: hypothetical protein A2751_01690 [Candidatus Doudnabacteria bacterium RIFCSPHIGHO2_01_FULL_46_14]|uniref:Glycerophosphoryl diester phosphodiesterase membrane domain-containing protein n=1 Tax=Candidatus Doudnabacteria bacterium RIFCSPHIGHO2_01_FULL_46_14 TaxID=1817824 RepID=A0A1F5NK21_9BACT|nr:MAG: hypothetical protein A2751_01690 [Candidatus Doudnabacteria bacterium RIFCSPHIGHO2_01_FULL_46_14]